MILIVRNMSFGGLSHMLGFLAEYYIILVPALGGLIVGPIIARFTREAKGHGVPEVMEAVAITWGGGSARSPSSLRRLRPRSRSGLHDRRVRKARSSRSVRALGSVVGQSFRMSDDRIRMLVACGAAGGIAATFNAPIAGVIGLCY